MTLLLWLWHRLRCAVEGRCPRCGAGLVGVYDVTYCGHCDWGLL